MEADAYKNPTKLFQLINNMATPQDIIQHALDFPEEVKTWIVSRRDTSNYEDGSDAKVLWRYLPLHLICLQQNPDKDVLVVMRNIYPEGLKLRDHHGNLPIHYLLTEAFSESKLMLIDFVLDDECKCLSKKDGEGRSILDIIRQSPMDDDCKVKMEHWLEETRRKSSMYSPLRPKRLSKEKGRKSIERQHKGYDDEELVQARKELKNLHKIIEDLEWKCEAKDNTIDSLTAQLMNLEKKVKAQKMKEGQSEIRRDEGGMTTSQIGTPGTSICRDEKIKQMSEEIISLKAQMKIDASIVSDQQEEIKCLETKVKDALKAKTESESKHNKLQLKVQTFQKQIEQHDEAVAHIRKVTSIMQGEVEAKEKENSTLKKDLEAARASNEDLQKQILSLEQDADKKFEGFQEDIKRQNESLTLLLDSFKDFRASSPSQQAHEEEKAGSKDRCRLTVKGGKIDFDPLASLQKYTAVEDRAPQSGFMNADDLITSNSFIKSATNEKGISSLRDNFDPFLQQTRTKSSVTGSLNGVKRLGLREDSDQKLSAQDKSSINTSSHKDYNHEIPQVCAASDDESAQSSISMLDIKERQSRLQEELRDIYSQIRTVVSDNDTMSLGEDKFMNENAWEGHASDLLSINRRLREENRPWKVGDESDNVEGTVYNI